MAVPGLDPEIVPATSLLFRPMAALATRRDSPSAGVRSQSGAALWRTLRNA